MEDDNDDKDDTKRKSRNLSEKKRRDQFNLLVNDLSALISTTSRKMDKSTVLKSTIAFLKHHNEVTDRSKVHEIQQDWKPTFLTNDEFTHLMLEALDGFIIVFSSNGSIHYTSESITSLLGYLPSDLLNMTIFDLAYEIDHENLYNIFLNPASVIDPLKTELAPDNQISLFVHLKRGALDKVDTTAYELVKLVGYLRNDASVDNTIANTQTRSFSSTDSGDKGLIFVGTGRVQTPQLIREMSAIDPSKDEFTSKHSMEWKFLFLDHRAPPIIGYMPFEVLGTSGYDYYHFDDLDNIIACHEELMQKGEGKSCFYRFLTKGQQWIWLQTDFYISYHQSSSKPDYVVCTHKVVSYADVIRHNKITSANNNNLPRNPSATVTLKDLETSAVAGSVVGVTGSSAGVNLGGVEKQFATATTTTSPGISSNMAWHSRPNKSSNYGNMSSASISPNVKRKRYTHTRGNESDFTSLSAESGTSRNSLMTHLSTQARGRHSIPAHLQQQQQQATTMAAHQQQQQAHLQQQHMQSQSHKMHQMMSQQAIGPQLVSSPPTQFPQPAYPIRNSQLVGHTFLEPQQYLTAIPMQPVIAPFPVTPVLSPMTNPSEMLSGAVVMTPTQTQIQDQLQRKHDELQKLIMQQQDELRRVSEQLLMARYTLLQPVVPVTYNNSPSTSRTFNFPNNAIDQQSQQQFVNYNFGMNPSDQLQNNQHDAQLQQHQAQSLQQQMLSRNVHVPDLEQFGHEEIDAFLNAESLQPSLAPPQATMNPQHTQQQQHLQQQPSHSAMSLNQHTLGTQQDDSLLPYMQMQTEPASTLHYQMGISDDGSESRSEDTGTQNRFNPYQTQNNQLPNELEILPYQMSQEESQILFNTPHTPGASQ